MNNQTPSGDMRERILQGALEVFSNAGYSVSTIKDISAHVGCNAITIFRHFEDKENLFINVVERFHKLEGLDTAYIKSRLSYTNVHADLAIMANMFFEILYKNLHILRVFIHDGPFFESIAKHTWYLSKPMQNFTAQYISDVYPNIYHAHAALIAEMFTAFVTRTCLRCNVHDGVMEYNRDAADEAERTMALSVDMITDVLLRYVKPEVEPKA